MVNQLDGWLIAALVVEIAICGVYLAPKAEKFGYKLGLWLDKFLR